MSKWMVVLFLSCIAFLTTAQDREISVVESLNHSIDNAVVQKDLRNLNRWYADDFVFTHGTGLVEGKAGWLKTVADTSTHYVSRVHDSLTTELHHKIAIVRGKLTVNRESGGRISAYEIWYVRVFAYRRKHWELISHRTISERHLN
jgi:ketosteroid isomerase-like protein